MSRGLFTSSRALKALLLLAMLGVVAVAAVALKPKPPAIGFLGCFPSFSVCTTSSRDGAIAAIEEYNRARGPNRPEVTLIVRDARNGAADMVHDLCRNDVLAIIGPTCGHCVEPAARAAQEERVLLLSPVTGIPPQLENASTFLSTYPQAQRRFDYIARHLSSQADLQHVAVIVRDQSAPSGDLFKEAFLHAGGRACTIYNLSTSGTGVRDTADMIADSAPDAVVLLAAPVDNALLAQHLHRRRYTGVVATDEFLANRDFLAYGGQAIDGVRVFSSFHIDHPSDRYRAFRDRFLRRFGYEPDSAAIHSYDATRILLTTMADADTRAEMMPVLLARQSFDGLLDRIAIDVTGDIRREVVPVVIRKGGFVPEE